MTAHLCQRLRAEPSRHGYCAAGQQEREAVSAIERVADSAPSRFRGQELQVPQRNRLTATQPTLDPRGRKAPELLAPLTIQEA
jgi:hypothetical protein